MKAVLTACAFVLLATSVAANAQQSIGTPGRTRGDTYFSGGCGSSWAICRYRTQGKSRDVALQGRLRKRCNPATAWMDACR